MRHTAFVCAVLISTSSFAQTGELLAGSPASLPSTAMEEVAPGGSLEEYEPFNRTLGGDSVRLRNGQPSEGWVEDRWSDGGLKHRGYYQAGRLMIYKNHHPGGAVEREFKVLDGARSQMRTWYPDGTLRSEALFVNGSSLRYEDHYPNGQLRYMEERHRSEPYFIVMDLFAEDGSPVSTLHLVDKKHVIFDQKEYHANGRLACEGKAQFDPTVYDSKRIGTWTYFDESGKPVKEEKYIEGRVHATRDLP